MQVGQSVFLSHTCRSICTSWYHVKGFSPRQAHTHSSAYTAAPPTCSLGLTDAHMHENAGSNVIQHKFRVVEVRSDLRMLPDPERDDITAVDLGPFVREGGEGGAGEGGSSPLIVVGRRGRARPIYMCFKAVICHLVFGISICELV